MSDESLRLLTLVSALGSGVVGGIFFAFSTFVMRALARLPPAAGMAAMRSINVTVINPWFLMTFFGTGAGCLVLVALSLRDWSRAGAGVRLAGSALYLLGTILVTIVFNVPRNDRLAAVDPASTEGERLWAGYVTGWTTWNHVRTVAAIAAAAMLSFSWR